jgi:hypothetical protein
MNIFKTRRSFRKELRRQIRLAIIAAVGFTVAFAWRNAIFDFFHNFVSRLLDVAPDHYLTETYTAIAITIAGVLFILITSKLLKE